MLIVSQNLTNYDMNLPDEVIFRMKITSKDEFEVLSKRVENLENKINKLEKIKNKKVKRVKKS